MNGKKSNNDMNTLRKEFYEAFEAGELTTIAETVRRMRKVTGLTQPDYAKLIGVAPRVLIDVERGVGNPTLKTLIKIGSPFGLVPGFRRREG